MSFLSKLVDASSNLSLINRVVGDKGDPAKQLLGTPEKVGGVTDPTKAGSASDLMGNLLRSEWGDYTNRFAPYDQRLIGLATSDEDNQQAIARARDNVGSSFDVAAGTRQRNNERLGLSNYADVTQSLNRQTANSRALAELSAVNKTRLHAQDRDKSIMSGDAAAGLKSGRLTEN